MSEHARPVLIPKDPEARARLARFAGLSDEERRAIDEWCHLQATENEARQRRGLEAHGEDVMGATSRGPVDEAAT